MKANSFVTTSVAGVNVTFASYNEGTTDNKVLFRMNKQSYQSFRRFYGKENSNWFKTFEVYAKGSGWYAAYASKDVVDGAVRIKHMIHHALTNVKNGITTVQEFIRTKADTGIVTSSRYVVKKIVQGARVRTVTVSRTFQAAVARSKERLSLIDSVLAEELRQCMLSKVSVTKLHQLQSRFN